MFTKRHEQDLAEIKALTHELGQRFQEVLEELEQIKDAQAQLAVQDRQATGGKRKSGRPRPKTVGGETPAARATGGKKAARSGQPSTALESADAVPPGKRGRKATAKGASRPSKRTSKRRRGTRVPAADAPVADRAPVKRARPIKRSVND